MPAGDWRALELFRVEELDSPNGMMTATSFIGPHRDYHQFVDWHKRGVIEVWARHPQTGREGVVAPADYAGVDFAQGLLYLPAPNPGWKGFTRIQVRFTKPPAEPPAKQRRRLFRKALDVDPQLTMDEAVDMILPAYPEAGRAMAASRSTLFRDFRHAKQLNQSRKSE
jgi:hypothetical protein